MLAMLLIEDVSTLLMMRKDCCRSAFRYCVVRVSQLPLLLPLSDRVLVAAAAAILVALGGKDVLAMILTADVLTLLMLIMDC